MSADQNSGASLFNPDTFLDTQIEGPLSTKPVVHPIGKYQTLIKDVKARKVQGDKGVMAFLDIHHEVNGNQPIDDGTGRLVKDVTNRDAITVVDSIILDLTPGGQLDNRDGMNFRLGRYREALNQNQLPPGTNWGPRMMIGQPAKIEVAHRVDPKDATITYTQVKGIEKM
jgi:hypothetical protein